MSERQLTGWEICYERWDPDEQPLREALTTLGNGKFATRGAAEEARAGGSHYPGTYLAGGYNRLTTDVAGRPVENEDLVNWPNWLPLTFRRNGGDWFRLEDVEILDYQHRLDLRGGVLSRRVRFRDRDGRETQLDTRRIVHMEQPHVAAIEWVLTALDWSGAIEIRSAIDGRVANRGVPRYRDLRGDHLEILDTGEHGGAVTLVSRTSQSHIVMAQAARTRVLADAEREAKITGLTAAHHLRLEVEQGRPVRVEKVLAMHTSLDFGISEPLLDACNAVDRLPDFDALLHSHQRAWRQLWSRTDLELSDDEYAQAVLRLHIFHLLQTASPHTIDRDVGVPARGLHGEAYRGHIFWDELFIFPFLNLRIPELTRSLLLYRYRRLGEARYAARQAGFEGAMFPWQSGSNGREESQEVHLNPASGRWIPDDTHRQRHVNAAIAYNVWQYHQATGDLDFLSFHGAELLLEIARLWASMATWNEERERYDILGVVGPDEFHTRDPRRDRPGVDNNAYTNVMAAWVLGTAQHALDKLNTRRRDELCERLGLNDEVLHRWDHIRRRMFVPFHGDRIISQFEGWEQLEELSWEELRQRHGDIHRLDRILEAEGGDPNRYQATKQADVLMLFYLFSARELRELLETMGYEWDQELIPRNVRYYLERTSHGSTLSRVVHAWVLSRTDRKRSWHLFRDALASDIDDVQGGTTPEGIHMGAMAGTVDLVQRCFAGLEVRDDLLWLNPQLPRGLGGLRMAVRHRGLYLTLDITHEELVVTFDAGTPSPALIGFRDEVYEIGLGNRQCFELEPE